MHTLRRALHGDGYVPKSEPKYGPDRNEPKTWNWDWLTARVVAANSKRHIALRVTDQSEFRPNADSETATRLVCRAKGKHMPKNGYIS